MTTGPRDEDEYFVLSRILDARHRPWNCSLVTADADRAFSRMFALGGHSKIEAQVVAASALNAEEIARYRAEVAPHG
jgi:hypothetical protein